MGGGGDGYRGLTDGLGTLGGWLEEPGRQRVEAAIVVDGRDTGGIAWPSPDDGVAWTHFGWWAPARIDVEVRRSLG
jgi:hypothetical protein